MSQDPIIRKPFNIVRDKVTKRWLLLKHNEVLMTARTKPELLRKIELKVKYTNTYHQNSPRGDTGPFAIYVGPNGQFLYKDQFTNLKGAFSAAKELSKRQEESYIYDLGRDRMIAQFVHGILTQETKQADVARTTKYVPKGPKIMHNPRRTLIYGNVNRIIATKTQRHICDADCKKHGHRYFHDFSSKPKMYGLPNGDLLITTR